MSESVRALDVGGAFDDFLPGYQPRAQQQAMAEAVEQAIHDDDVLIVEAGTGVGKTFAYLTPAILSRGKVIVSTGTKALQDQLFEKDLPTVIRALGADHKTAILKGRANYLCLYRMKQTQSEGRLSSRDEVAHLNYIREWSTVTPSGDKSACLDVPEESSIWPQVTSTTDNCLGQECDSYDECFVMKARKQAQEADLVVINHHLFFADLSLKESGFVELLPDANTIVLDEAHQLPEIAGAFFGVSVTSRQLNDLARDLLAEYFNDASDISELRDITDDIKKATADFRLAMGMDNQQRQAWLPVLEKQDVDDAYMNLMETMEEVIELLKPIAERGKGLESCMRRSLAIHSALHYMGESQKDYVLWFETFRKGFSLHATPLEVRELFRQQIGRHLCSWVLTSATLTVDHRFDHFAKRLGLEDATTLRQDSPFDYQHNARLYLPQMPEPSSRDFVSTLVEKSLPLIRACEGRAFLLFTSYRAMNEAADLLDGQLEYPVLVQGEQPKGQLLKTFREHGNALLLGTSSFWEGVDVRGDALSLVVIDKIPFASPSDPVLEARLAAMQEAGENPFMQYQVPQAVVSLKQGVGRLIRDVTDKGLLMLCDPRLSSKFYGKIFLRSLPKMTRCQSEEDAVEFLRHL